jgi:DNA polymerase (family 10)
MALDRKKSTRVLREISRLLEVQNDNVHRVRAFANASRVVERLEGDLEAMVESSELLGIKGIGKGTFAVLEELAAGRTPKVLQDLEKEIPVGVREMLEIHGLGPKKVRALWQDLGAVSLGELEYACRENRLVELPGFGAKTQERLLESIRFARHANERRLINEAWAAATALETALAEHPAVDRVVIAGEVRRFCETADAVELVVVSENEGAAGAILGAHLSGVEHSGPGRWIGVTGNGFAVRARVVGSTAAATALVRATGSEEHLDALSERASTLGLELRDDGLWQDEKRLECPDEDAVYRALGCRWVPPELREDGTEVAQAAAGSLPELVTTEDVLGVLHNHTTDSDGAATVGEMAAAARARGWSFFGVADHSPVAVYANGVTKDRLHDQWRRIDELNRDGGRLRIVKGLEADVLSDGTLDIPQGCEDGLEYVVASIHSAFRLSQEQQTERIMRAVSHAACSVLGHPTGRLLLARPGYEVDLECVLQACLDHGVAVEINASPYRLDLGWRWARRALELGLKLAVDPDAHSIDGLDDIRWGLAVARKAGATASDLVNCSDIDEFLKNPSTR